jgi:hypothetical protein
MPWHPGLTMIVSMNFFSGMKNWKIFTTPLSPINACRSTATNPDKATYRAFKVRQPAEPGNLRVLILQPDQNFD